MDHFDPRWVWYAAGILSALAVLGYLTLYLRTRTRFAEQDQVFDKAKDSFSSS
jgi:bacteriorhodopsin